jgi:hypothetical protein
MLKWLLNNKEWLFSGGGIVVMVFLFRFIARYLRKRKLVASPAKEQPLAKIIEGPPVKASEIKKDIKTDSLSADAIMARIEEAPFLQQPDIIKHYIGLRVTWDGTLVSAEKKALLICLLINVGKKDMKPIIVSVDFFPSQCPGIGLLKYGHPIRVSGVISKIHDYFELNYARIEYKLNSLSK